MRGVDEDELPVSIPSVNCEGGIRCRRRQKVS